MNGPEMVLGIIIVVTIGSVLRARYGIHRNKNRHAVYQADPVDTAENVRLRDEVRSLKERVQVLERPRMESTSTSSSARSAATSGCSAFQRSTAPHASSLFLARAISSNGCTGTRRPDLATFSADFSASDLLTRAREGPTRLGSPACFL